MLVLTALLRTAMRTLGNLFAPLLAAIWRLGARQQNKPNPFYKALGNLALIAIAVFGLSNLYFWATSGVIYRLARHMHGGSGWISFDTNPIAFVFWASLSSLPLVIPIVLVIGYFSWKKQARRAALRQFIDGTGSARIVRRWDGR